MDCNCLYCNQKIWINDDFRILMPSLPASLICHGCSGVMRLDESGIITKMTERQFAQLDPFHQANIVNKQLLYAYLSKN